MPTRRIPPRALDRRGLLKAFAGVGAIVAVPGLGACSADPDATSGGSGESNNGNGGVSSPGSHFTQPVNLTSRDGTLATALVCTSGNLTTTRGSIPTMIYEGHLPGPTLRVNPGDTLSISLTNHLPESASGGMGDGMGGMGSRDGTGGMSDNGTNLHTHGLHVSPRGNSDNVFLDVPRGSTQQYEIQIPADHWGGLNWYHPHRHGSVSLQVLGGLAGALIVAGPLDEVPQVAAATEQVMVLQRIQSGPAMLVHMAAMRSNSFLSQSGNPEFTVNGVSHPQLTMAPGELQRWRIINADPIDYFDLTLLDQHRVPVPGGLKFLARDGMTLSALETVDHHLMVPGNRFDLLVQAPPSGPFTLTGRTAAGFGQPDIDFLRVQVAGSPVAMGLPTTLPAQVVSIPATQVTSRRVVEFGSWDNAMTVNGVNFSDGPDVVPLKVGEVTEWTVLNNSDQQHAFHIHTNPFQVVAENGVPLKRTAFWDTYPIPPATGPTAPGSITVRMKPVDFTGKIVQHCHILPHEDAGMMGVVELQ